MAQAISQSRRLRTHQPWGLAAVRAPVERRFAHLENWRVLAKSAPTRASPVGALLVLTDQEVDR
ncbi:hypothetical protein ACIBCU_22360 [Streptomyces sp. NPDC051064]|uniref:hypothetical protein n=1 Tax=Streptomyces sp. NPDC051064 TaxID=3365641 RepID=UPI0037A44C76